MNDFVARGNLNDAINSFCSILSHAYKVSVWRFKTCVGLDPGMGTSVALIFLPFKCLFIINIQ